MKQMKTVLYS